MVPFVRAGDGSVAFFPSPWRMNPLNESFGATVDLWSQREKLGVGAVEQRVEPNCETFSLLVAPPAHARLF